MRQAACRCWHISIWPSAEGIRVLAPRNAWGLWHVRCEMEEKPHRTLPQRSIVSWSILGTCAFAPKKTWNYLSWYWVFCGSPIWDWATFCCHLKQKMQKYVQKCGNEIVSICIIYHLLGSICFKFFKSIQISWWSHLGRRLRRRAPALPRGRLVAAAAPALLQGHGHGPAVLLLVKIKNGDLNPK